MLTPQDITGKTLKKAVFGGYSAKSVDAFREEIAADFAAVQAERDDFKDKLKLLAEKVEEYREAESAVHQALISAQISANAMLAEAEAQREKRLEEIRIESERLFSEEKERREALLAEETERGDRILREEREKNEKLYTEEKTSGERRIAEERARNEAILAEETAATEAKLAELRAARELEEKAYAEAAKRSADYLTKLKEAGARFTEGLADIYDFVELPPEAEPEEKQEEQPAEPAAQAPAEREPVSGQAEEKQETREEIIERTVNAVSDIIRDTYSTPVNQIGRGEADGRLPKIDYDNLRFGDEYRRK